MSKTTRGTSMSGPLDALADRLIDHADSIVNAAAHDMELDLRLAASALRQAGDGQPHELSSATRIKLGRIATRCADPAAARELRRLINGG